MAKRRWHREDIKAEVRKRGKTLTQLALDAGVIGSACRQALSEPCFHGEQIIADFLKVPAQELWPERYDADGTPRHPRIRARILAAEGNERRLQTKRVA